MRIILILWAIPIILFWGWYALSAYDLHFGFFFLERRFHDVVFNLYSQLLGVPADEIPALLAGVFVVDTLIILGVAALRWYKLWLPQTIRWMREKTGLADEQREYVRKIYQPTITPEPAALSHAQGGPGSPAE